MLDSIISRIQPSIRRYRFRLSQTNSHFEIYFYATINRYAFKVSFTLCEGGLYHVQYDSFCDYDDVFCEDVERAIANLRTFINYGLGK